VARYRDSTTDYGALDISLAGGLTPEAIAPIDKLVERATTYHAVDPKGGYRSLILALALYRAGKFQEALDRLLTDGLAQRYVQCSPVLALSYEQLGDRAESKHWFTRATDYYERTLNDLSAGTVQKPGNWEEFCICARSHERNRRPAAGGRSAAAPGRRELDRQETGKAQADCWPPRRWRWRAPRRLAIGRIQAASTSWRTRPS
jgi:tetratricopeptide (TPR) repeat protein